MGAYRLSTDAALVLDWFRHRGADVPEDADQITDAHLRQIGLEPDPDLDTIQAKDVPDLLGSMTPSAVLDAQARMTETALITDKVMLLRFRARDPAFAVRKLAAGVDDLIKTFKTAKRPPKGPALQELLAPLFADLTANDEALRDHIQSTTIPYGLSEMQTGRRMLVRSAARLQKLASKSGAQVRAPRVEKAPKLSPERIREILATGEIVTKIDDDDAAARALQAVTIRAKDGTTVRAILKAETRESWRSALKIGPDAVPRHEAAMAALDQLFGFDLVPPTVLRDIGGQPASLQVVEIESIGARDVPEKAKLDLGAFEKMRLLDFVTGNWDRRVGNYLLVETPNGYAPRAIDNGYAFTKHYRWATCDGEDQMRGPLLDETLAHIEAIDPTEVARVLADFGVDPEAARLALQRLEVLKADPTILEMRRAREVPPMIAGEVALDEAQTRQVDDVVEGAYG